MAIIFGIFGIIGSGKSTFGERASKVLNCEFVPEEYEANPFLEKFYKDPRKYAWDTQQWFVKKKWLQEVECRRKSGLVLLDSPLLNMEIAFITAQRAMGWLNDREYDYIWRNIEGCKSNVCMGFYMKTPLDMAISRIENRSRHFENHISLTYLAEQHKSLKDYISSDGGRSFVSVNPKFDDDLIRHYFYQLKKLI